MASQTELCGCLNSFLDLLWCSYFIRASSDIVKATQVHIVSVRLSRDSDKFIAHKSSNSVEESHELDVLSLSLPPKKTVNDIICTWSLSSVEDHTNFLRL